MTLPFEVLKITKKEDTVEEFRKIGIAGQNEDSMVEFIKLVIMEYSDSVNEENLTVRYKYASLLVDTKTNKT